MFFLFSKHNTILVSSVHTKETWRVRGTFSKLQTNVYVLFGLLWLSPYNSTVYTLFFVPNKSST